MIPAFIVAGSLICYAGLVSLSDRKKGVSFSQLGTIVGAILLFIAQPQHRVPLELTSNPDLILGSGVGVLSATAAAMGYHLYLGRFASAWAARGVFLMVSIGIAISFLMFLAAIG